MIRSTFFLTAIVLYTATAVKASAIRSFPDSKVTIDFDKRPSQNDTSFTSISSQSPLLSFQNIGYKLRLDSLQTRIPLDYNEHVQRYIDIYLQRKEHVGKMLGLSKYYFPIYEKALLEAGLPDELKFISVVESSLNPHAVSKSGAVGPWQFMYTTAKGYGLQMDTFVDERKDPVKASYAAAHYIVDAYKRIGDWLLTIAAFNCGTGAVVRAIERSGGIADFWKVREFLPKETQNYVPAFIATVYTMNYAKNHDIQLRPANFGLMTDVVLVNQRVSISHIAKAADLDLNELLILNPSYKKQIINGSREALKSLVIPKVNKSVFEALYDVLNGGEADNQSLIFAAGEKKPLRSVGVSEEFHRVKPGQNLSFIANLYGIEVQDLKVWNTLKSLTVVPGQNLRVKASTIKSVTSANGGNSYLTYVVKAGDTLSGIAEQFNGMTVTQLKALNGLTRSSIIPGMKLKVNHL